MDLSFYKNKNVLVTGHTGFKGTWLCQILANAGANVTGYGLKPLSEPNLFNISGLERKIKSIIADIRDYNSLSTVFAEIKPEIVIHLAAQPLVRESYRNPRCTYETNVMGTVNLLECVRLNSCVRSVLNVTTDKVYKNNEWCWGYREDDPLDGFDPYSNSKSCSELATHSYLNSFFQKTAAPAISTVRAGNVIGGGDFSDDRIIPDCVRAMKDGKKIGVRNPYSIRPYQYVLEPLAVYLMITERQYRDKRYAGFYNIGPEDCDCITTGCLVDLFCEYWGGGAEWINQTETDAPHEAHFLKLDCSKLKDIFAWRPRWNINECMKHTTDFYKAYLAGEDISAAMDREIRDFLKC